MRLTRSVPRFTFEGDTGRRTPSQEGEAVSFDVDVGGSAGGWLSAGLALGQAVYSLVGLIVGLASIALGGLLVAGEFTGDSELSVDLGGGEWVVSSALPGVVFAVVGALVIWMTRYSVRVGHDG